MKSFVFWLALSMVAMPAVSQSNLTRETLIATDITSELRPGVPHGISFPQAIQTKRKITISETIQNEEYYFEYEYKKGKKWNIFIFNSSLKYLWHIMLNESGNIQSAHGYVGNDPIITKEFYSNGQLKIVYETKSSKGIVGIVKYWNVFSYFYPDGKPFENWGTLKDGVGTLVILDDQGEVCDSCSQK
jgi:hypothetical protein